MSWRKAKKIILIKPHIIDPLRCRSTCAAKKLLMSEGIPPAVEVFTIARLRAGMSIPQWEEYIGISHKVMERKYRRATPIQFGHLFMLSRRAVVFLAAVILITMFMACTPTGRAWAVAAYNAVAEVIDGILYIRSEEDSGNMFSSEVRIDDTGDSITRFETLDDMLKQSNIPVFFLAGDAVKVVSVQLTQSRIYGDYLECVYVFVDDVQAVIRQDWGGYTEDGIILDDMKEYINITLDNGIVIDGAYSQEDGIFVGSIVTDDTIAHVFMEGLVKSQNIVTYLQSLSIR